MKKSSVDELREEITFYGREISAQTIQFHRLVAEHAGLTEVDHKYLDILLRKGKMTAGKLSKLSGLSTGAITAVLDRLEKQNLISRERDDTDRRKVYIVPNHEVAMKKLGPIFAVLEEKSKKVQLQLSEKELKIIYAYMKESTKMMSEIIDDMTNRKPKA